ALQFEGGRGGEEVSLKLLTIVGLGFEPSYLWFDDGGDLFASVSPEVSLVRRGRKDLLPSLKRVQERAADSYWHEVAARSIHPLAGPLLIQGVRVFDSLTGKLSSAQDVLVQDGLVKALSADGEFMIPPNAGIVEGQGKVLMPGLWDMHGHVYETGGVMNLAVGVTHARDMGNTAAVIARRDAFDSGDLVGPDLQLSGFLDRKSKYSSSVVGQSVRTLKGALAAVDDYADAGYELIKLYASIDPDWIRPIADAAHARGLRVAGHVPAFTTATRAVEDGYDEITHMTMVLLQFVVDPAEDTRTRIRFTAVGDRAGTLDLEGPEVTAFLDLLAEKGTVVDPTLAGYVAMFLQEEGDLDPRYEGVGDHLPPDVYRMLLHAGLAIDDSNREAYLASADAMLRLAKKMHERGIVLVPGTDDYPGLTLLADLAMWVEAGISNAEVLQMATHGSAKVAGVGDQEGVIRPGAKADLILIDGDPTTSIRDLQRVQLVVRGDTYLLPFELHQALGMVPFTAPQRPRPAQPASR
ncbi:MAG: amidohydrolase family protein, partial [Thermoanaerobaculia bacterium]|nr:amidohydrolase family protein [Thermoanaerobaculia bacterium]